jgi:hypothetical protein
MLRLLSQYLFQFQRLPLPEFGSIQMNRHAAQLMILDKKISPAYYSVEFRQNDEHSTHLIEWLAGQLDTSAELASLTLKDYISKIKETLKQSGHLEWGSLGTLKQNVSGEIIFDTTPLIPVGQSVVVAEKIVKEDREHVVLIGDRTYSGEALQELLAPVKKNQYLVQYKFALIIFFITALATIYLFYSRKNFFEKNQLQLPLTPNEAPASYSILPTDE